MDTNRPFQFQNAVSFSSARTTKRFPSPRCASVIQMVRPLESTADTQPQLQPALLRSSAMIPKASWLHHTPPAALRGLCLIFESVKMREIFAGVPTVRQRCASPVNSCQPGIDKQSVQVTTAAGCDDCIVASWSKNSPPTRANREWLCESACRECLRLISKLDCLRFIVLLPRRKKSCLARIRT